MWSVSGCKGGDVSLLVRHHSPLLRALRSGRMYVLAHGGDGPRNQFCSSAGATNAAPVFNPEQRSVPVAAYQICSRREAFSPSLQSPLENLGSGVGREPTI